MKLNRLFASLTILSLAISVYGQKVNTGNVVGIFETVITLEANMTFEEFERLYLEEYIPAAEKNFPGIELHLLIGERGIRTGKYTEFIIYDSLNERNRWFPEKGQSSEEAKKAFDNMREIQDRIMKMTKYTFTEYLVL